ncbi:hypothetical protein [Streptomyces sp. NPDC005731]|uniref:hypothetical protein n=1 Tax=Streptomyces sp. NPDC005731 TaxID=3157056 RepID=UPI0033CDD068
MSEDIKNKIFNYTLGAATLIATAYAFLASIYGSDEGPHQQIWVISGVASSALAVFVGNSDRIRLTAYRERLKSLQRRAEINYENLLSNLAPSVSHAAIVGDTAIPAGERSIRRGRLDQSITVGVSEITEGVRGVFYSWNSTTSTFTLVSQWPTAAVAEITSGHVAHATLERVVKDGEIFIRPNTASPFSTILPSSPDDRVAAVRVIANTTVIGILAMDAKMTAAAPASGFDDRDVRELLLYADLLAAGLGAN